MKVSVQLNTPILMAASTSSVSVSASVSASVSILTVEKVPVWVEKDKPLDLKTLAGMSDLVHNIEMGVDFGGEGALFRLSDRYPYVWMETGKSDLLREAATVRYLLPGESTSRMRMVPFIFPSRYELDVAFREAGVTPSHIPPELILPTETETRRMEIIGLPEWVLKRSDVAWSFTDLRKIWTLSDLVSDVRTDKRNFIAYGSRTDSRDSSVIGILADEKKTFVDPLEEDDPGEVIDALTRMLLKE